MNLFRAGCPHQTQRNDTYHSQEPVQTTGAGSPMEMRHRCRECCRPIVRMTMNLKFTVLIAAAFLPISS
jgi:hypothetical protein